jgi:hypothetical protein
MKLSNLFFGFCMATYFMIGSYTSTLWGEFYYSVVFTYIFCLLIVVDTRCFADQVIGGVVSGTMWVLYMTRPLYVEHPVMFEWIRFSYGCLLMTWTCMYFLYCIWHKISKRKCRLLIMK